MTHNSRRSRRLLFAMIVFCLLTAASLQAQIDQWGYWQNGLSEPWWFSTAEFKTEEADTVIARWNAIGAENQVPLQPWAGDYFAGSEVHGTYLRWSPQGGFVITDIDKCQAKVMRATYGRVNATSTMVEFIPEFRKGSQHHGNSHGKIEPLSTIRFVPVSWRGIFHLVPAEELSEFGDLAAGLGNYNSGLNPAGWIEYDFYYKLNGKESGAPGDLPVFPAGYEQFLKKPIEATITSVTSRKVKRVSAAGDPPEYESHSTVAITAGSASGVKRGMIFRISDSAGDRVEIIRVRRASSLGIIVRTMDDHANEIYQDWDPRAGQDLAKPYPPIAIGWRVTTAP